MQKDHFLFSLLLACLLGIDFGWAQSSEPTGFPFIETYHRGDFPGARQTWGLTRSDDGLLYFGNSRYGIQETDGLSFRNLWMNRNSAALSFAKHTDGSIFVGGQADFGVLQRDSLMKRSYTSLSHLLPDSLESSIEFVEFIFVLEGLTHFVSAKKWYVFSGDEIITNYNQSLILSAAKFKNSIVSLHSNSQVSRFQNGETSFITPPSPETKILKLSDSENRLFMLDNESTIWELNDSNSWSKTISLSKELTESDVIIKDFYWSQSGYIHFATSNGLFTYNQDGDYLHTIFEADGLCDNDLIQIYEDDDLNIWVSSSNGVSILEYGRPMREFLASAHDLPEYSATLINFNGSLYTGGFLGLFVWDNGKFRQIYDDNRVFTFEIIPHGLLIGTENGLQLLNKDGRIREIASKNGVVLIHADRENSNAVYYVHDRNALRKITFESETKYSDIKLFDFEKAGYTLTEDRNGDLWIGTGRQGDYHFETVQEDSVIVSVTNMKHYSKDNGLPSNGFNYTMSVGNDVGFITSDGFYRLTEERDSIVIDNRFEGIFEENDRSVWPVVQDEKGGIWLSWAATLIGRAVYNSETDTFDLNEGEYTRTASYRDIDFIYPTSENRVYLQTYDQKLAYYDSSLFIKPLLPVKSHITSLIINADSLLLEPRGISHTTLETPIAFEDKRIRFNYGIIKFLPEEWMYYQIKLEGLDDDWSNWTNERYRDYTNLSEGKYKFMVRGSTLYPDLTEEASFSFVILPPWYRTWLAFILYALFGLGGVITLVKIREKGLLERQQELEDEVLHRTEEIRSQKEELEKLDIMKNTFFSNVSHEFRTPLTISSGLVDKLMKQKEEDLTKTQYILSVIKRNMVRLDDMVSQIIDLTKSDQNHLSLRQKHYKADNLASIAVESFRSLAEYHGHQFEFYPDAGETVLYADRSKVEIMINNLISNAIKFTADAGAIEIRTSIQNNSFILTVQDTGSGIPDGDEEVIFERFHRIKRAESDYVEGMGVGLELSRTLARLHNGEIRALPGFKTGACFELQLPIAEFDSESVIPIVEQLGEDIIVSSKNASPELENSVFNILLVEDNEDMMEYVQDTLSELGTIKQAKNGKEALQVLDHYTPDIIITDLMMPVMGGTELVEKLSGHEQWKQIPVIVLTAKALEEDRLNLLRIGVVDYITKPFLPEQLILKTKNLLTYYTRRKKLKLSIIGEDIQTDSDFLKQATMYVSKNISNSNLSVDKMADEFSQSRSSLYRNLQLETGMTPAEFIREIRLTSARQFIAQKPGIRLEELANAVGYKSATSFRKVYEERFGEHPLG